MHSPELKTDFLPNCAYVFDLLKKELANQPEEYDTLVEIGAGGGDVLHYLSSKLPKIKRFIVIDLCRDQMKFSNNKKT